MNHEHVRFEDVRRFTRFTSGISPSEDARWVVEYTADVRFCASCGEITRQINKVLLPDDYEERIDPNDVREDCLSLDEMMELRAGTIGEKHLHHCAACELRYYEAAALSAIGPEEFEEGSTESSEPGIVYSLKRSSAAAKLATPILAAGYRVAASFGALILGSDLISGLLGPGEDEPVAEAVVREGHALKDVRIELDAETQTLVVAALPASYPAQRLRLRTDDELLEPAASSPSEARFDLSGAWDDGDHNFELVLVEP